MIYPNKKCIIVGSHPEALKFRDLGPDYIVIAVNESIHISKDYTDYWFTLDPHPITVDIMRTKPYKNTIYTAAVPDDFGDPNAKIMSFRVDRPEDVVYYKRIVGDGPMSCHYGLCEDIEEIATGNSAYGALNLAYHFRCNEIILLGVSGNHRTAKFNGKYCADLSHLPDLFSSALFQLNSRGIKVSNATKDSIINCLPYNDIFD